MSDMPSGSGRDPVEQLLESFLVRWRRGERPSPEEYTARCPERADEVRELLPALVEMEQVKPAVEAATGSLDRPARRSVSADGNAPTHPERLGDYRILRVVGEGGMGVVYEAEHESLKNRVALKVMHCRFRADRTYLKRFRTEARSAARLHHTNIVPVFDFGEHDEICYYAMQYIGGVGLNDVLNDVRRLRSSPDDAGRAGTTGREDDPPTEACDGPVSAAAHGLLTGRFATAPITPGGSPLPTVSFQVDRGDQLAFVMAPDQPSPTPVAQDDGSGSHSIAGQPESIYFREVARLGAQVADALDYAHRQGVVHRDIKPSNLLLDARGNAWVTDFGLAKLVEGDELSQSHDLVGTLRFMAPERFRGVTDRRGDIYALGATLYELLALRPAFAESDHARLIDQIVHQPLAPLRQHDPRIPRDLETIVLRALSKDPKDRCDTAGELRDELRRFLDGRPTRWRRVGPVEQFRRWCKRNPVVAGLNALAATLTILIAIISTVAAYSNGRLATQLQERNDESDRNLIQARKNLIQARQNLIQSYTTEAEARRVSRRVGQRFEALDAIERAMRLAPEVGIDEAQRLRLRNGAIAAMALPDLRVARELDVPRAKENGFAVDQAFERYAFKRDDGTVVVRRLSDDAELLRFPGLPSTNAHAHAGFSPDGRYLAMNGGKNDTLEVFDLEDRRRVLAVPGLSMSNVRAWAFDPDGREIASGLADGTIVFHRLPGGREVRRWARKEHDRVAAIAYSPDGARLAITAAYCASAFVRDTTSGRVLAELAHPKFAGHLAWNPRRPNSLAVGCDDNKIYVWDTENGSRTAPLEGDFYNGLLVAYHPGGELLASRGWNGVLRLWDVRTGRMLLSQPSAWFPTLQFDRAGRWLGADATGEKARILEFADAAGCRTLAAEPFRESDRYDALAIDPAGRRLVASGRRATVWDLPSEATLATLPVEPTHRILFDASGAVLTGLPALLRWPVTEAPGGATTIGPPQLLQRRGTRDGFAITPDGRTIAAAMHHDGGLVFDARNPQSARWLGPQRDVRNIAISPDGRWVVTGSHGIADGMKLWDARTGHVVHDFPGVPDEIGGVRSFSLDGRWLAVDWDGWVLFETTTWTLKRRLLQGVAMSLAFAPDSRTVVYDDHAGSMILAEVATGRELARFEDPEQSAAAALAFSPDGSRLVTTLADRPYLRIWDLGAIRRRLAGMGLDWDPPAMSGTSDAPVSFPAIPKPTRVDRGQFDDWLAQSKLKPIELALIDAESSFRQGPDQAEVRSRLALVCNNLAWTLATGPAADRDPARALTLARRAVELAPDEANYLNTLGVALYRAARLEEAVTVLERSLAAGQGKADAFDLFFLAMARHELRQIAQSRTDFDRAVKWRRDHPNQTDQDSADLDAFQAEAQALLNGPLLELPADVFARDRPDEQ
jgi:serine/threonine protein kinase/WD40 repeat protein